MKYAPVSRPGAPPGGVTAGIDWASADHLRVRSGDYRVIYTVDDSARVVTIAAVGHRREIYRRLGL
jgi:hypothetical protein